MSGKKSNGMSIPPKKKRIIYIPEKIPSVCSNHRIKKASINTTEIVEWEYFASTLEAITSLRKQVPEIKIVAVELAENSIPYTEYKYQLPVALLVGHESFGVSNEVMKACDAVVELPMYGVNISLNVMVSLAIALYEVLRQTSLPPHN
jgi:tRNA G18 (ribose-2'-O)-methylase SpoU